MSATERLWARVRRAAGPPEDSVPMRVAVAVAVEVAILAVVAEGGVHGPAALLPLVLAPVGYLFSYRQRARSNITTKVLLSMGLLVAFAEFLQNVRVVGSVDQARVPLASLFLWVQVLHAFDVPRRRDLAFSMVSSVILMAEAGALSLSSSLIAFILPWAMAGAAWLFLSSTPAAAAVTTPTAVRRRGAGSRVGPPLRSAALMGVAALVASTAVFMVTPRLPGGFVRSLPFSLTGSASAVAGFAGGVDNPGLPAHDGNGVVDFSSNAYPGFGDTVDLRARGHLSDRIAFRVRASQASLWRAEAFDTFDGTRWTISDASTLPLTGGFDAATGEEIVPASLVDEIGPVPTVHETQTFYMEAGQPNVLFAAAVPQQVYFPAGGLRVDRYGSIRSPILLDQGLVYSVVSQVPVTSAKVLRLANPEQLATADPRYLELPPDLPARDAALARRIAAGAGTEYDRVLAVQAWVRAHTTYDLDVPSDPPGVDAVDRFLFVTRRGFCEQIASSMAILLRTIGIPTRLVTGYGPGQRNPLTGYFDVRQSDAHAWVEVEYPGVGWVPYDPTFGVPAAAPSVASRLIGGEVIAAVKRFLADVVPAPVKDVLRHAIGGLAVVAGGLGRAWPLVGAFLAGLAAALLWWRRRRSHGPPQPVAIGAYLELTAALAARGHPRVDHATPREYLRWVSADPAIEPEVVADAEVVVATLERDRFSGRPAADADLARARDAAAHVRRVLARR